MPSRSRSALLPFALASLLANPAAASPRQPVAQTHPRAQTQPRTSTHSRTPAHPRTASRPRPKVLASAAKADSLDGVPGHHFGEPRSNFPELATRGFNDPDGYVSYSLREGQQGPGWFARNADQINSTYWFYQDQFAAFSASAHQQSRQLLLDEATYLFGRSQNQRAAFGQVTFHWLGQRVAVELTDGHNTTTLGVTSKRLQTQQLADKAAKQKAEAAARAAKFKADNAP